MSVYTSFFYSFLNVIEDSHISKKINLSRNIGLGYKDDLLDELDNEENS